MNSLEVIIDRVLKRVAQETSLVFPAALDFIQ